MAALAAVCLLGLAQVAQADLPVHCPHHTIKGSWSFSMVRMCTLQIMHSFDHLLRNLLFWCLWLPTELSYGVDQLRARARHCQATPSAGRNAADDSH